ncbi:hypothetical protein [Sphingobium sp. CFD-1]|uniref:hypothetical protein n=1 Tax=Sphingobium sp. CFD-1 TaxID=2878545 RepID=UPI0035A29211
MVAAREARTKAAELLAQGKNPAIEKKKVKLQRRAAAEARRAARGMPAGQARGPRQPQGRPSWRGCATGCRTRSASHGSSAFWREARMPISPCYL